MSIPAPLCTMPILDKSKAPPSTKTPTSKKVPPLPSVTITLGNTKPVKRKPIINPDLPTVEKSPINDFSGELTNNEFKFILDTTLNDIHRKDMKVLLFIESFVRCRSIIQAASEVGVHNRIAFKWRHCNDVANAIQKITEKSLLKYGFDSSEIFERVKEVVEFDPIMLQNADGSFKSNLHDIEPEARRNIKKLKVKNIYNQNTDLNGLKEKIIVGEIIEYEFYDKLKAAELTGREKDMFKNTTKVEHGVTKDMADLLLESARRADERKLSAPCNPQLSDVIVTKPDIDYAEYEDVPSEA